MSNIDYMYPYMYYYNADMTDSISLFDYPYRMLSATDIFDYEYEYEISVTGKPKNFKPKISPKNISIVVQGKDDEEIAYNKARLMEIIDADTNQQKEGKLFCGRYWLSGFFVKSEKPNKYINVPLTIVNLTFYPSDGNWMSSEYFYFSTPEILIQPYLDYDYDYDYDFCSDNVTGSFENKSYVPSEFLMRIFGPAINPTITIGQWNYGMTGSLGADETLVIDSINKKMYVFSDNENEKTNVFNQRFRDFYAFQPIPVGENIVAWNGNFDFSIELYDTRREPKWAERGDTPPVSIISV